MQQRIISLLLENEAGSLSFVAGLFSARGFNIESLNVAPTADPTLSRMTLVTNCSDDIFEQIKKQLNKLINVVKLQDFSGTNFIERELLLIKIKLSEDFSEEAALVRLVEVYRGRIVDMSTTYCTVEITGSRLKLDGFMSYLENRFEVFELSRTGVISMSRGGERLQA